MICASGLLGYLRVLGDECEQLKTGRTEAEVGRKNIREGSLGSCSRCDQATAISHRCNSSSF